MKLLTTVFFSLLVAVLFAAESQAQYSEDALANAIAQNSPYPASSYQSYARSLEKTLAVLSPNQLTDIFRGPSDVNPNPSPITAGSSDSVSYEDDTSESAGEANAGSGNNDSENEGASTPPDHTTAPEYNDALEGFNEAYNYYVDAQTDLTDAQDHLNYVIEDSEGLRNDNIPGNFIQAFQEAIGGLIDAQETYVQAQTNLVTAQAELDDIRENGPPSGG